MTIKKQSSGLEMVIQNKIRNERIDFLRFIGAFLVLTIHSPFSGIIGLYIEALSRIAVPIYILITAYYYWNIDVKDKKKWVIKQSRSLFFILFWGSCYYFIFNGIIAFEKGMTMQEYLRQFYNIHKWVIFIIFNNNPFSGHLWYLSSIIYAIIIVYIIEKIEGGVFLPLLHLFCLHFFYLFLVIFVYIF